MKGLIKKILIALVVIVLIGAFAGGGSKKDKAKSDSDSTAAETTQTQEAEDEEEEASSEESEKDSAEEEAEQIEYTTVSVDELLDALENNAMNAKDDYEGTYIRATGTLRGIDASGKYFTLEGSNEYSFIDLQCYILDDATKDRIKASSTGDQLVVCGKITMVGEVLGYSMDVDYIE